MVHRAVIYSVEFIAMLKNDLNRQTVYAEHV